MASKMPAAVDDSNRSITVSVAESSDYTPPLKCEFCDAQVSFVNGFTREVGDSIVYVNPFFRLRTGYVHGPACKYNVEGQLKVIARESEGDVLVQTNAGKFEVRLLAVRKAIRELQGLEREKKKGNLGEKSEAKAKKYVKAGSRLGSYINSAMRVLKVRALCEDSAELENMLELVFDGVRLPWRDFYFEDENYFRCYSSLVKATVKVPIAICGVVESNKVIHGNGGDFSVIDLVGPYRKTDTVDVLDAVNVSIWSPDLDVFKGYKADDRVLAFGLWDAKEIYEKSKVSSRLAVKTFRNHDLRLWPVSKAQVCKVRN